MKKIILIIIVVFVVFLSFKKNNIKEVSLIKKFNDEYYSFDNLVIGDRKYINYSVTNDSLVSVKVRVKITEKWINSMGKIINVSDAIILSINNNDWYYDDGYYYYKHVLDVGNTTEPLIYYIELNDNLSTVKCTSSDSMKQVCTGDMSGLAGMSYKISFKNNLVESNVANKIWK